MMREFSELMEIVARNNTARVYSVSNNDRYFYPYRLASTAYASDRGRGEAFEYMLDSRFDDESVTNRDVLQAATKYSVDYVFPKDYPGEQYRTHESVKQFERMLRNSECNATMYAILQPPYDAIYEEFERFYSQFSYIALGGLHDYEPHEQIRLIEKFREVCSPHQDVHALGVGTSLKFIRAMRNKDPFVDSVDVSTAEMAVKNGKIPDGTWKQQPFHMPSGKNSTTIRGQFAKAILFNLNYFLGPDIDDDELERQHQQSVLSECWTSTGQRPKGSVETLPTNSDETTNPLTQPPQTQ